LKCQSSDFKIGNIIMGKDREKIIQLINNILEEVGCMACSDEIPSYAKFLEFADYSFDKKDPTSIHVILNDSMNRYRIVAI